MWGRNQPIVFLCPTCIKSIYIFSIWKPIFWIKSDAFFVLMCCKPINCMNAQIFFIISNNFIIDWPIIHICQTTQSVSFFIFCLRLSTRIDSNIIIWARQQCFTDKILPICKILETFVIWNNFDFFIGCIWNITFDSNYYFHVELFWLLFSVQLPNTLSTLFFWPSIDICLIKPPLLTSEASQKIKIAYIWCVKTLYKTTALV